MFFHVWTSECDAFKDVFADIKKKYNDLYEKYDALNDKCNSLAKWVERCMCGKTFKWDFCGENLRNTNYNSSKET